MENFIRIIFVAFMGLTLAGITACDQRRSTDPKDEAIKVNNTVISIAGFNELIKQEAYTDPELEITQENRARFADYLIQKELMIQEAVNLSLDQREDFTKTIEKYWESTLIRTLLDLKTAQFKAQILITKDDIQTYYLKNKDELGRPYEAVKEEIRSILLSRELEDKLALWIKKMKESANISINKSIVKDK